MKLDRFQNIAKWFLVVNVDLGTGVLLESR